MPADPDPLARRWLEEYAKAINVRALTQLGARMRSANPCGNRAECTYA